VVSPPDPNVEQAEQHVVVPPEARLDLQAPLEQAEPREGPREAPPAGRRRLDLAFEPAEEVVPAGVGEGEDDRDEREEERGPGLHTQAFDGL
jgi:hypothetical protein